MKRFGSWPERGVALVVVLWAAALVSLAMIGLAGHLQAQLMQEKAAMRSAQALLVAESGIQMALHPGVLPQNVDAIVAQLNGAIEGDWLPLRVRFQVQANRPDGSGDLSGEEGRLNLNSLLMGVDNSAQERQNAKRILTNLLIRLGIDEANEFGVSARMVDCLIDWVDQDDQEELQGAERADYEQAGLAYRPPNRRFLDSLNELLDVLTWRDALQNLQEKRNTDWRRYITIYGNGRLDLKFAESKIIEVWLDLQEGAADPFVRDRRGLDGLDNTLDDPPLNPALLPVNAQTLAQRTQSSGQGIWRVTSRGQILDEENKPLTERTVVALVSRDVSPPQIRARWIQEENVR